MQIVFSLYCKLCDVTPLQVSTPMRLGQQSYLLTSPCYQSPVSVSAMSRLTAHHCLLLLLAGVTGQDCGDCQAVVAGLAGAALTNQSIFWQQDLITQVGSAVFS